MFWSKNKKQKNISTARKSGSPSNAGASASEGVLSSAQLRVQAMENARAARAHIGEDTIQKIAATMSQKQSSATEKAKEEIELHDAERIAVELLILIDEHG